MMQSDVDLPVEGLKKRDGWWAFLLSLLAPSLGQFYNGKANKAVWVLMFFLCFPFLVGAVHFVSTFSGFLIIYGLLAMFRLLVIIDAVRDSRKQPAIVLKWYNRWYYYLLIWIIYIGMSFVVNDNGIMGFGTFRIAFQANAPSILEGDVVVVDFLAYQNTSPQYGDLVAFVGANNQVFVYRVIAKGGEDIGMEKGVLSLNGYPLKTRKTGSEIRAEEYVNSGASLDRVKEIFPNGKQCTVFKNSTPILGEITDLEAIHVPLNTVFLMGDNRGNAVDSRYIGLIPKNRILGKVCCSVLGNDWSRVGKDL